MKAKRMIAALLALTAVFVISGCARSQTAAPQQSAPQTQSAAEPSPQTAPAPQEGAAAKEKTPPTWRFEVETRSEKGEYKADDGTLLATVSYEYPRLVLKSDGDASGWEPPEDRQAACDAFNKEIEAYRADLMSAEALGKEALDWYNEMSADARQYFPAYYRETNVVGSYLAGDLLCVNCAGGSYYGGAHGVESVFSWKFDLAAGKFFDWQDLTDRPDALREELAWNLLGKIEERGESDWCFEGYEDTILAKEDFNVSLGETGMTVAFSEYEIMPYAGGIPEYEIPYAEFSRFLNARGERLLPLTPEDKALGDYYEAEELRYWLEGAMPMDETDSVSQFVKSTWGDYDMLYYRVDVPGVTTLAELRAKLLTRFSDELTERMLAGVTGEEYPLLQEFDGKLYVLPAGRGADMYIDSVDYRAELNADGSGGTVYATIHWRDYDEEKEEWVLTDESIVEFPFETTGNGARFTDFTTIW